MRETDRELLGAARRASAQAYCPYSHFPVGAAVSTADGRIFTGCNIENASYSLTICAERVALFSAIAAGVHHITGLAVSCPKGTQQEPGTYMPCGACRQVMQEFLAANAAILIDGIGAFTLATLLPFPFRLQQEP